MPGGALEEELDADLGNVGAVVLDGIVGLVPGIFAPAVVGGIVRHRSAHRDTVAQRVHIVVPGDHIDQMLVAFDGAEVHQAAERNLPALVGSVLVVEDFRRPERSIFLIILVTLVVIRVLRVDDRDEVDVLPSGIPIMRTIRIDDTDRILPDREAADESGGEILDGGLGGLDPGILGDGDVLGIIPGRDRDNARTACLYRVIVDGDADGDIAGGAGRFVKMDPLVFGGGCPCLFGRERDGLCAVRRGLEGQALGADEDGQLLVVEFEIDLHVLEGVIDIGVNVVVRQPNIILPE